MSPVPRRKALVVLMLALWLGIAPGCSWCRSVGDYYSSSRWHEDLQSAAGVVLVVGFVAVVGIGLVVLGGQEGADLTGLSYTPYAGSRGSSGSYSYRDYYRTKSRMR